MKDLTLPTPAIKPCPFCGGEASARPRTCNRNTPYNPADRAFPIVRCGKCGAEAIGDDWKSEATAIEKWNRRAALSSHHEDGGRAATRGVVVPMEATEAMLAAVRKRPHPTRPDGWDAHHATLWRAMVAAHQATGGAP